MEDSTQIQTNIYHSSDLVSTKQTFLSSFTQKIAFIILFTTIITTISTLVVLNTIRQKRTDSDILLETRYKKVVWENYGEVFEPIIEIPIYYADKGYQNEEFLLDSGALVSSLPREKAEPLGFYLAMLPRSTFRSFGNSTAFAYRADLKIKLGNNNVSIPVVFTESAGTKPILGRIGFFEKYSVYFDSREQKVQIKN